MSADNSYDLLAATQYSTPCSVKTSRACSLASRDALGLDNVLSRE